MTYQCPHCYRAEDEPHRWDCEDSQISVDDLEKLADAAVAFEADEIGPHISRSSLQTSAPKPGWSRGPRPRRGRSRGICRCEWR